MALSRTFDGKLSAFLIRWLPWITAAGAAVMALSLKFRFLDTFIATTWHGRIGYDLYSVPRAFINLLHGQSIFCTRCSDFGPYATWFPYHPAVAVLAGSWLSVFSPQGCFWVFAAVSFGLLALSAYFLSGLSGDRLLSRASYFILICSLPAYLMVWNGQMHVFTVLSVALVMADMYGLAFSASPSYWKGIRVKLMLGIVLCLLSKPMVIPAMLLFLAVKEYRKTLAAALAVYALISALFVLVPFLNPQRAELIPLLDAFIHPMHAFRTEIYRGVGILSYKPEFSFDNAVHWLNMRLHVMIIQPFNFEKFSMPVFLSWIAGRDLNPAIFKLPGYVFGLLGLSLFFVRDARLRLSSAIPLFAMSIALFYLSYDSVYEYHYITLIATMPAMLALYLKSVDGFERGCAAVYCAAGALLFSPTCYYWIMNPAYGYHTANMASFRDPFVSVVVNANPYPYWLTAMRLFRVVPAMVMYCSSGLLAFWMIKKGLILKKAAEAK